MKYLLLDDWGGRIHNAKKTVSSTEDDLMCWAAAASNILAWTRWGYEYEKDDQDVMHYLGIYITDSDDDSQGLRYYELTRSGWSYDDWWYFQYYKDSTEFFISEVHALDRYPSLPPSPPSGLRITSSS